jgi:hypothetical protein
MENVLTYCCGYRPGADCIHEFGHFFVLNWQKPFSLFHRFLARNFGEEKATEYALSAFPGGLRQDGGRGS